MTKTTQAADCTFCREPLNTNFSGGQWDSTAVGAIYCCHRCALRVLPCLMADSVHINSDPYYEGRECLAEAEGAFWKAMTYRASRARKGE